MMSKEETKQLQDLKAEVEKLRSEVDSLREFVKAIYSMMDEGEQYESSGELLGGIDFRGLNT